MNTLGERDQLVDAVRHRLVSGAAAGSSAVDLSRALGGEGVLLGSTGVLEAAKRIKDQLLGLGPLQQFVDHPKVTDILVNGAASIWIDAGNGLERVSAKFASEKDVRSLAQRLISAGGRRLDDSMPCADVRLGFCRVHAMLPPLASAGTLLSIRVLRQTGYPLSAFVPSADTAAEVLGIVEGLVKSRRNVLVSGGTGSGKTSFLGAFLSRARSRERIILVEDATELHLEHEHALSLQSKHANAEGAGEITLVDLLRQAMRMRPDRLVVGECRGAEVRELLAAMNTGHVGSGGTLHANSASSVPARLIAMGALAGMSPQATSLQAASAVDAVIHVERQGSQRVIQEIGVLESEEGNLRVIPALVRDNSEWVFAPAYARLRDLAGFAASSEEESAVSRCGL